MTLMAEKQYYPSGQRKQQDHSCCMERPRGNSNITSSINAHASGLAAGSILGAGLLFASLFQSTGWNSSWIHVPLGAIPFLPTGGTVGVVAQALGQSIYGFFCGYIALYAGIVLYKKFS